MKIACRDLVSLLSDNPSVSEVSEKLFQLGHEHEINGEFFELELTPNRGDCQSLVGLARDLNPFYKLINTPKIFDGEIDGALVGDNVLQRIVILNISKSAGIEPLGFTSTAIVNVSMCPTELEISTGLQFGSRENVPML